MLYPMLCLTNMVTGYPELIFDDLTVDFSSWISGVRGRLDSNKLLSAVTWFRVGGPAQLLFAPKDEDDLCFFLQNLPVEIPVRIIGLGSNLLIRDGGLPGVTIRLSGRGFSNIEVLPGKQMRVGAAMPDAKFAKTAAVSGIGGFSFYRGVPGAMGGALRMNAGAHGTETRDGLISVRAVDRSGNIVTISMDDMGYSYRHCSVPDNLIFVSALFQGKDMDPDFLAREMDEVTLYREQNQPVREKTGGSTFKNPDNNSAWKLIDQAGLRGKVLGGARFSDKHCNFLINEDNATAFDLESLGELARTRVYEQSGVQLEWEIRRWGDWSETGVVPVFTRPE